MKIKLSKNQWEFIGKKAGWIKSAETVNVEVDVKDIDAQGLQSNQPQDAKQQMPSEAEIASNNINPDIQKIDPKSKRAIDTGLQQIVQQKLKNDKDLRRLMTSPKSKTAIWETFDAMTKVDPSKVKAIVDQTQKIKQKMQ